MQLFSGASGMPFGPAWYPAFILLSLWSLFWKGCGLWHSAQRKQGWWFIAMLVLNTAGILEIVYLFGVAKLKADQLVPKK